MSAEPSPDAIPLGNGHWYAKGHIDGALAGIHEWHRDKRGEWCTGWIPLQGPQAWTVESENPLTIMPSVLCVGCDEHGWIRDGRWQPA